MASTDVMLTTIDNPYDPFTDYEEWLAYDEAAGHHTNALLARITMTSEDLSEADQEEDIIRAIDEIIKENVSGIHIKAYIKT